MVAGLSANTRTLSLPTFPEHVASVDICFDGARVWSIDLRGWPSDFSETSWPAPLVPFLTGRTCISVLDSASGIKFAESEVSFTDNGARVSVVNENGDPLAINKWGRLARTLTRTDSTIVDRILDHTTEIMSLLADHSLRPFIVGGTLLGAVREQALLPHDDDADIAYLSQYENPAEVAREGFKVSRLLEEAGYEVVRHSATHMQLYFRDANDHLDHYVDVFAAFFDDEGYINQPFHVRGRMAPHQLIPFKKVKIGERKFDGPRDANAWLTINYDENWRTPIPGYKLETPLETQRRFQNWFGEFHMNRDFWNEYYTDLGTLADETWQTGANWLLQESQQLTSKYLLELGSGNGALAKQLKVRGRKVIASDYTEPSPRLCEKSGVRYHHINLHRLWSLAGPKEAGIKKRFDLVANHVLAALPPRSIQNALRLAHMALISGGKVRLTEWGAHPESGSDWPKHGHLPPFDLRSVAQELGMNVEIIEIEPSNDEERSRAPYGARLTLAEAPTPHTRRSIRMKSLFSRIAKQLRPGSKRQIARLTAEVDELRNDHAKVAEMLDLIEYSLTPREKNEKRKKQDKKTHQDVDAPNA